MKTYTMQQKTDIPLVSVLLPCYNAGKYLRETMDSILSQTYTNFEVIAIDDCSTDNTYAILQESAEKDKRIIVYRNETNLKLIRTLNKGISLCRGIYIARMDADDICMPERFEKQVDFLEENKDYDVLSTQFATFRKNPAKNSLYVNPLKYEELQAFLLFKSGICHPASMIRKTLFTDIGLKFEEEYLHVEDYALWSKALYKTRLANLSGKPLLLYRVHDNQVSSLYDELQTENKKKVFKIHCENLGLDCSPENMTIYSSVAEAVPYYSSYEFLTQCEEFMLSLIERNNINPFCSGEFLEGMLSLHWVRLCANSRLGIKVLKRCFSSPLYIRKYYTNRDIIVLFFKALFRIKYKKSLIYKIIFR